MSDLKSAFMVIANRIHERLEGNDEKEILKVIGEYSKAIREK